MHLTNLLWFQSVTLISVQIACCPVKRGGKEKEQNIVQAAEEEFEGRRGILCSVYVTDFLHCFYTTLTQFKKHFYINSDNCVVIFS
jgi:hypothetical protein